MTSLAPRGPLPARVYWFRRLMLLSVVFLVVFGMARLVGGGDEEPDAGKATTVAAETGDKKKAAEAAEAAEAKAPVEPSRSATPDAAVKKAPAPRPAPSGVCTNSDVTINPVVAKTRKSTRVVIGLVLRTKTAEACTWQVSPSSVTIKIDSGSRTSPDDIWQSRQCPDAVPTKDVTLYKEFGTRVMMVWNGRRSDSDCSDQTDWAKAGWYYIKAAAYAGEPTDKQFELKRPATVTVTQTVEPKQKKSTRANARRQAPTPEPSGAVEPNG
ncbi:hypothetical protein [Nocardioides gilvus]|uniref:hypothetical protein n=1 Tax=Nocardioides gilvus TaxID=1735589 RepID=UPI0013A568E2|nr:hypothetical protein [Nocardioides gilvus]